MKIISQNALLRPTYPETHSYSMDDPTHTSPVLEKQETSPSASKSLETERMKIVNNHVEEINHEETNYDSYKEINREERLTMMQTQQEEEEICGEGTRTERSGDRFVNRLKCLALYAIKVILRI
ncbi:unnamed protein product [Brassica oleracea]